MRGGGVGFDGGCVGGRRGVGHVNGIGCERHAGGIEHDARFEHQAHRLLRGDGAELVQEGDEFGGRLVGSVGHLGTSMGRRMCR